MARAGFLFGYVIKIAADSARDQPRLTTVHDPAARPYIRGVADAEPEIAHWQRRPAALSTRGPYHWQPAQVQGGPGGTSIIMMATRATVDRYEPGPVASCQ